MIFERCTFIIICIALSGLSLNSSQAASSFLNTPAARDKIILGRRRMPDPQQSGFLLSKIAQTESRLKQPDPNRIRKLRKKPSSQDNFSIAENSINLESVEELPKSWAFGAMALTSSIALFLLWLLFRKPKQDNLAVAKDNSSVDKAIASSALNLETDNSVKSRKSSLLDLTDNGIDIDVIRELIQDLQSEDLVSILNSVQTDRRRKAIWELTKIGDYRSIEPLLKIMPQARESDKSLIIEAVTQINRRSFQPIEEQLFASLEDVDPGVRLSAVRDLKNLYQFVAPAITKIAQMQSDADYEVRQTAIQALVQLNANPLPTFSNAVKNSAEPEIETLVSGEDSEANLHLVAYLLAELDAEK